MKRSRIKAIANVSVGRKVARKTPTVDIAQKTETNNLLKLVSNVKTELSNNFRQENDSNLIVESNFINYKKNIEDISEIQNSSKVNIKLENEELHIFHEVTPVIIHKDSCQNESILPTHVDNNEISTEISITDVTEPGVILESKQNQSYELPKDDKVTIHDVIHNKRYYTKLNKEMSCSHCNIIGCTSDHSILNKEDVNISNELSNLYRVKVGSNGELVIDAFTHKRRANNDWNECDNKKFYKALQLFGTDFALMKSWFPHKSRNEIKSKFKKEEKLNGALIDSILKNQTFNADVIQQEINNMNQRSIKSKIKPAIIKPAIIKPTKKSKKRKKCRFVVSSIELSSTDNESDESEDSSVNDAINLRHKEVDNILKTIKLRKQGILKAN